MSRKSLFVLVLCGLLLGGAPGCYKVGGSASDADADTDSDSDSDSDTGTETETDTGTDYESETDACGWGYVDTDTVPDPSGTSLPAETGILCDAPEYAPSNDAARLELTGEDGNPFAVTGFVAVPESLTAMELVSIEPTETDYPDLTNFSTTDFAAVDGGFTFSATWPTMDPDMVWDRMGLTLRATIRIDCGEDQSRLVQAETRVELCRDDAFAPVWRSSGEECTFCQQVCEMDAAPLPAEPGDDPLPLSAGLRVSIAQVMHLGRTVVLVAEPQGVLGAVSYEWRASGGIVHGADLGGVVWELPEDAGPHLLQLVVRDGRSAAVASHRVFHAR